MPAARKRAVPRVSDDIFDLIGRSESIAQASAAMQAMAHPLRLKILCLVGNQELSVLEIVEAVGTSQSNVSQHLAILRGHGILLSPDFADRGNRDRLLSRLRSGHCGDQRRHGFRPDAREDLSGKRMGFGLRGIRQYGEQKRNRRRPCVA